MICPLRNLPMQYTILFQLLTYKRPLEDFDIANIFLKVSQNRVAASEPRRWGSSRVLTINVTSVTIICVLEQT